MATRQRDAMSDASLTSAHPLRCIDGPDDCAGPVEERWPGHGERTWPRCELHGRERQQREVDHEDSTLAPANFDPAFAGESWDPTY